jgi:hypothetical protein
MSIGTVADGIRGESVAQCETAPHSEVYILNVHQDHDEMKLATNKSPVLKKVDHRSTPQQWRSFPTGGPDNLGIQSVLSEGFWPFKISVQTHSPMSRSGPRPGSLGSGCVALPSGNYCSDIA